MRSAQVLPDGSRLRWAEIPGVDPTRVYLHGLGASSAPYYAEAVAHPALRGHRSLLVDLLGFGISDQPADAAYTLEQHADVLAHALDQAAVGAADVVAHSAGGAVAVTLAARHPGLVRRLVLVDAPLDPVHPLPTVKRPGSSGIGVYRTEEEFLDHGRAETLEFVGSQWAATMRQAGPEALYRTAINLLRGTVPTTRELLAELTIPVAFLYPAAAGRRFDADQLAAVGVAVTAIPDCGHNIMVDNVEGFAVAVAAALRDQQEPARTSPGLVTADEH